VARALRAGRCWRRMGQVKGNGCLARALPSHDAGWYHVGEPGGSASRPSDTLFTTFRPALRVAGCTDAGAKQLTVDSPREALTARVRAGDGVRRAADLDRSAPPSALAFR
jgi:hypothetical protein